MFVPPNMISLRNFGSQFDENRWIKLINALQWFQWIHVVSELVFPLRQSHAPFSHLETVRSFNLLSSTNWIPADHIFWWKTPDDSLSMCRRHKIVIYSVTIVWKTKISILVLAFKTNRNHRKSIFRMVIYVNWYISFEQRKKITHSFLLSRFS